MTPQTAETLKELAEVFRYEANRKLKEQCHGTMGHILHALSNVIREGLDNATITPEPHQGPDFS